MEKLLHMEVVMPRMNSHPSTVMVTKADINGIVPEARNFAWLHTEDDIGLVIDFRLKRYIPLDSIGVDQYSNPGTRDECLVVDLDADITALNTANAGVGKCLFELFSQPRRASLWNSVMKQ